MENMEKFKELILYVAMKSENDPKFGATKLNKILFYADFLSYRDTGCSISGQTYIRLPNGPAPKLLKPAVRQMQQEFSCAERRHRVHSYTQHRLLALREPNLELFNAKEIARVDQVISDLWQNNATEVSDLSHEFIGWKLAGDKEEIPFYTVFVGDPLAHTLLDEDREFIQSLVDASGEDRQAGTTV